MEEITKAIASKVEEKDDLLTNLPQKIVPAEDYKRRNNKLEEQIKELEAKRTFAEESSTEFQNAVATAFRLASKAHQLFTVSQNQDKHDLIEFMFAKLQLRGKKLEYTLRKPFDMMLKNEPNCEWLPEVPVFLTSNYQEFADFDAIYSSKLSA